MTREQHKNARLMWAAPDMYEALREAYEYLSGAVGTAEGGDDEAVMLARKLKRVLKEVDG